MTKVANIITGWADDKILAEFGANDTDLDDSDSDDTGLINACVEVNTLLSHCSVGRRAEEAEILLEDTDLEDSSLEVTRFSVGVAAGAMTL